VNFDAFVAANPLVRFSIYTHLQSQRVIELGSSIKARLDFILAEQGKADISEGDAYGDIWLWTLGAYEVVRTMADPKWEGAWSPERYREIVEYKRFLADMRVPFAKQELRSGKAVSAENSVAGVDHENRTYFFEIEGKVFDVREQIDSFEWPTRRCCSRPSRQ